MTDIFGRFATIEAVLVLMLIGSAICFKAPVNSFPVLILGRAIQGLSVAGINVSTRVILADKVSLKEYSKNNSIFALVGGVSYALGPVIGGFLTNTNWRWCFGINLPIAGAGLIVALVLLRPVLLGPQPLPELQLQGGHNGHRQRLKARISTIDFGGQFLFLSGMSLLILALTWGGGKYRWDDAHVIAPLILGAALFIFFVYWEYLMVPGRYLSRKLPTQKSTIPWDLLSQRNMGLLFYINFATGMCK